MADVELGDLGDGGDGDDIVEGEAVPCVRLDAVLDGEARRIADPLELGRPILPLRMRIAAGVELDDRSAEAERGFDLFLR